MSETKKWYESEGEKSDVVISTRIRLARNLNGYPFPHLMNQAQMNEVCQKVRDALIGGNSAIRDSFRYVEAEKLSPAATLAKKNKIPFIYRVHESPDPESLQRAAMLLRVVGVDARKINGNPKPADIDRILSDVSGKPYEEIVSNVLLRAMAKARYDTEPLGHYGLALIDYCHFTSPIRRYPDTFIHRMLSQLAEGKTQYEITKEFYGKALDASALSSEYEVRAVNAERRTEDCYMAEYMSHFIGDEFDGTISHVTENGFFVRLQNSAEGMVHLDDLPHDEYEYDGLASLRGRLGNRIYRVGDSIKIIVASVRISVGRVQFSLACPEGN